MSKRLVLYYSLGENTRMIAEKIAQKTGADLEEIDTEVPYTGTYNEIVTQGQEEVNRGYMPKMKPLTVDIQDYEEIYIGTPTWWYTMAPVVLTLLHDHDFTGKTVILFQTHAGWPGHCLKDMEKELKGAKIKDAKTIQFSATKTGQLHDSLESVDAWIKESVK